MSDLKEEIHTSSGSYDEGYANGVAQGYDNGYADGKNDAQLDLTDEE
jgi:flagellar biosynthesis/type III secretory pathway protein FliH